MNNNIPESVQAYLSAYRYKIELHAHTRTVSPCSELLPKDMISLMKEQHYDAVVITNHFCADGSFMKEQDPVGVYLSDFLETREEGKKRGIQVLLGVEYRFTENSNEYLIYGGDEAFLREAVTQFDIGIEAFYKKFHRESLLILQAHPFRNGMTQVPMSCLDGIETMNMHPNHNSRVAVATRCAENVLTNSHSNISPIVTIGTDLHHKGHEGVSALRTKVLPKTESQLVEILRGRDYIFDVGGCPMIPYYVM